MNVAYNLAEAGAATGKSKSTILGLSPSMRWKTDWIQDWNKWSGAERVLALVLASLLLGVPLSFVLASR
jgi:hypothetical protein